MPGRRLQQLRPYRDPRDRDDLQGHLRCRDSSYSYQVRAVDAAGNLGALLEHRGGHDPGSADSQPPSAAGDADGDGRRRRRDRPRLGRSDRQRRCHRLPDVPLPGRRLHQLRPSDASRRHSDDLLHDTTVAAATTYGYEVRASTQPATSARSRTPSRNDSGCVGHHATVGARDAHRRTPSAPVRSTSHGARRPTMSVSPATRSFRCTGAAVRHFAKVGQTAGGTTTLQRHGAHRGDELQLRGSRGRRRGQPRPLLQHRVSDDVSDELERAGRGLRLQRGNGHDGRRCVGERQRRHGREHDAGRRPESTAGRSRSTERTRGSTSRTRRRCS